MSYPVSFRRLDGVIFLQITFYLLWIAAIIATISRPNVKMLVNASNVTILPPLSQGKPSVPSCAEQNSVTTLCSYSITQSCVLQFIFTNICKNSAARWFGHQYTTNRHNKNSHLFHRTFYKIDDYFLFV